MALTNLTGNTGSKPPMGNNGGNINNVVSLVKTADINRKRMSADDIGNGGHWL